MLLRRSAEGRVRFRYVRVMKSCFILQLWLFSVETCPVLFWYYSFFCAHLCFMPSFVLSVCMCLCFTFYFHPLSVFLTVLLPTCVPLITLRHLFCPPVLCRSFINLSLPGLFSLSLADVCFISWVFTAFAFWTCVCLPLLLTFWIIGFWFSFFCFFDHQLH